MSGKGQEKQANKKKNKNTLKDQAAQPQAVQPSRDTPSKPASAPRKSTEISIDPAATAPASLGAREPHVSMNNFNAAEVEAMLGAGAADKGDIYRPDKPTPKAGGVWGAKAGAMGNGKDFWLQLRKQVAEVQANGGVAKAETKKQGG